MTDTLLSYLRRNAKYGLPWRWKAGTKAIYRRVSGNGMLFAKSDLSMCSLLPVKKVDRIIQLVKPTSVLDVGCGTGKTLAYFHSRGVDVFGVEGSRLAIQHSETPRLVSRLDVRYPFNLGRVFDLVWCFEVAEHIGPKWTDNFVDSLVRHSRVVAISAAPPGQGGEGHFNEQPQEYWQRKFSDRGYTLHAKWTAALQETDEFYSKNMMVFVCADGDADSSTLPLLTSH